MSFFDLSPFKLRHNFFIVAMKYASKQVSASKYDISRLTLQEQLFS